MKQFWLSVFSEVDGTRSLSRVLTALHSAFACGWGSYHVYHAHAIPDPTVLVGLAGFVVAPYTVNKASGAIKAFSNNPEAEAVPIVRPGDGQISRP